MTTRREFDVCLRRLDVDLDVCSRRLGVTQPRGLRLGVGEGGGGDRREVVSLDDAEPAVVDLRAVRDDAVVVGDLGHPVLAGVHDLVVVAAHEVPPHHDLLAERSPADDEHVGEIGGLDVEAFAGRDVRQLVLLDLLAVDPDQAEVDQYAVLEARVGCRGSAGCRRRGSSPRRAEGCRSRPASRCRASSRGTPGRPSPGRAPPVGRSGRSRARCRGRPREGRPTAGRRAARWCRRWRPRSGRCRGRRSSG